ncbi:metallophosphoesterase [Halobaculum sp. MBLA0147]|uniref:metallophosphoesterase n=1 Tax=Halobaculum sp. MBLA0147 TaxID=3079934 RepID=UPI0035234FA0
MARYVVSDHHFGHANIVEYCDRPFNSVGEMDRTLVERHFEVVDPGDTVVHLGDIAMDMRDGHEVVDRMEALGVDLLVQGNHDIGLSDGQAPSPVVDHCLLSHDDYQFLCVHRPADTPDSWDGWVIHGHHHNNDLATYPLIDAAARRVNVGVDVTGFQPLALDALTDVLEECSDEAHVETLSELDS